MELLRLLLCHPAVELVGATSRQEAGKPLAAVFPRFRNAPGSQLAFMEPDPDAIAATGAQVAFLALPHGVAAEIARALLVLADRVPLSLRRGVVKELERAVIGYLLQAAPDPAPVKPEA